MAQMSEAQLVAPPQSSWTIDTLKQYVEFAQSQSDSRNDLRFRASEIAVNTALAAQEKAVAAAFESSEKAVAAAFAAQEKAVAAAFAASDKAIIKAEDAQKEYNTRSNEFRGQLNDQANLFISRSEVESRFMAFDDKLIALQKSNEDKFATIQIASDDKIAVIRRNVDDRLGTQQLAFDDKLAATRRSFEERLTSQQAANDKTSDALKEDIKGLRDFRRTVDGRDTQISRNNASLFALMGVLIAVSGLISGVVGHFIK